MRKLFIVLAAANLFVACGESETKEKPKGTKLEMKFDEGMEYEVILDWEEIITNTDSSGKTMEEPIRMKETKRYIVEKVDTAGTARIRITTSKMKMGEFDSEDSTTWQDPFTPMMKQMMDKVLSAEVTREGIINKIEGAEGMYGDTSLKVNSNKILLDHTRNVMDVLPLQVMDTGGMWEKTDTVSFGYPAIYHHRFKMKEIKDGIATIEVTSEITPHVTAPPTVFPGDVVMEKQELSGTRTGTIQFDVNKGRILSIEYQTNLRGPAEGKIMGDPFARELSTRLAVKYTFVYK